MPPSNHSFHIPVMGTGFTVDTPLRVAHYGLSSVISLVDDSLLEDVRRYHCQGYGLPYQAILPGDRDARARRVTAYLNLIDVLVTRQVEELQGSPFEPGSAISKYFRMLPPSNLKRAYLDMLAAPAGPDKIVQQDRLRRLATPGDIDVNIMTKLDSVSQWPGAETGPQYGAAMAALRGYANSNLNSSMVFSAGINPRLYTYTASFNDFFPDLTGRIRKRIILKVSDFRSAEAQGKFLAKRGLWVSEFRIESGLNCGGHAFATTGHLLGPVLEEFQQKKADLVDLLQTIYRKSLAQLNRPQDIIPSEIRMTVQGGIGTSGENNFLHEYYRVDGTGWGTPFLLVPEVTCVDQVHIDKMLNASQEDVYLSQSSPLGVSFWNLRTSASEENRRRRIRENRPGSPCTKGFAALSTEFGDKPSCPASISYIKNSLKRLSEKHLSSEQARAARDGILEKSCICNDLSGGTALKYGLDPEATPAICCGPNILNFKRMASLEEMVDHIYGRLSLLKDNARPHMFIKELRLYVEQLRQEIQAQALALQNRQPGYLETFKENLLSGIDYYRGLAARFMEEQRNRFLQDLEDLRQELGLVAITATN